MSRLEQQLAHGRRHCRQYHAAQRDHRELHGHLPHDVTRPAGRRNHSSVTGSRYGRLPVRDPQRCRADRPDSCAGFFTPRTNPRGGSGRSCQCRDPFRPDRPTQCSGPFSGRPSPLNRISRAPLRGRDRNRRPTRSHNHGRPVWLWQSLPERLRVSISGTYSSAFHGTRISSSSSSSACPGRRLFRDFVKLQTICHDDPLPADSSSPSQWFVALIRSSISSPNPGGNRLVESS